MTTEARRHVLTENQIEMLRFLEEQPLSTTREVAGALGLTLRKAGHRLTGMYAKGLIARQEGFDALRSVSSKAGAARWQVMPR